MTGLYLVGAQIAAAFIVTLPIVLIVAAILCIKWWREPAPPVRTQFRQVSHVRIVPGGGRTAADRKTSSVPAQPLPPPGPKDAA